MDFNGETKIQKIVRQNTPDFFVSTNYYAYKFHSYQKWMCPVVFKKGNYVRKTILKNGQKIVKDYDKAMPDFVLMNKKQMQILRNSIKNAEQGKKYDNPFIRTKGYYCQVFGEYWHSQQVTLVDREEHIKQVKNAYESNGNKVLILWQNDILYHYEQIVKPQIQNFILQFKQQNEIDYEPICFTETLGDMQIRCLNESEYFRTLTEEEKQKVVQRLVEVYSQINPFQTLSDAKYDLLKFNESIQKGITKQNNKGNSLLNYFIKSRYKARVKGQKSICQLWQDKQLMRHCIRWQLQNESGVHHAKRFLFAMMYKTNFRNVNGINQNLVYVRMKKYSKKGGIFFDSCAGWGGRLLASYALGMKYIAIDANKQLVEELKQLSEYIGYKDCQIYHGDSSNRQFVQKILNNRKIDLCFTSPPYFDKQIYSEDEIQSIKQYKDIDEWHKKFLGQMCQIVLDNLNVEGNLILNVDDSVDLTKIGDYCISQINYSNYDKKKREDPYYHITRHFNKDEEYVVCQVCGKTFKSLKKHLRYVHDMTVEEYLQEYKESKIVCGKTSKKIADGNKRQISVKYNKRFVYLLPDGRYTGKSDKYKKQWNVEEIKEEHILEADKVDYIPQYMQNLKGEYGIDYVVCKICGCKKGSLTQHIRKQHNLSKDEYLQRYGGQIYSEKNKKSFHECSLNKWKTQKGEKYEST